MFRPKVSTGTSSHVREMAGRGRAEQVLRNVEGKLDVSQGWEGLRGKGAALLFKGTHSRRARNMLPLEGLVTCCISKGS